MVDLGSQAAGRALTQPPLHIRTRPRGEFRTVLDSGGDPPLQPLPHQLALVRPEPPRARSRVHPRAAPPEGLGGRVGRVRAEQAAALHFPPLVLVERGGDLGVTWVTGGQNDAAGDRQGQQDGAPDRGARVDQAVEFSHGEQVKQCRRGHQVGAPEVGRIQDGQVGQAGSHGNGGAVRCRCGRGAGSTLQQVRIVVVEDPVVGTVQTRREPTGHRTGAAPEVMDDQLTAGISPCSRRGEMRTEGDQQSGVARVGVGSLPQGQPVGLEAW